MPNIKIQQGRFESLMGRKYPFEELDTLGFEYGIQIEHDDQGDQSVPTYKFDCMNNRPDLLTEATLTRALKIYLGLQVTPTIRITQPTTRLIVDGSVNEIRPIVVAAILRNVSFDDLTYKAFINAQQKLHATFCRARKYASIGTHDLDTIQSPFKYSAIAPNSFKFIPLNMQQEVDGNGMIQSLQNHKLKQYLHLIQSSPVFPVVTDSKGRICSVPPIINSQHSKISINTKNVLIQVTGLTKPKANVCLNTMIWSFSQLCKQPFTVQPVTIQTNSETFNTPNIQSRQFIVHHHNAQSLIGAKLDYDFVPKALIRMGLKAQISNDNTSYKVQVPFWRGDILHQCDILQDIAICYGYNKINPQFPSTVTIGSRLNLSKFCDFLRRQMAQSQYNEVLNFALCSKAQLTTSILNNDTSSLITIANAKTKQFQTGRTTLLPGLLRTVFENKSSPLPFQLFEVGDCIYLDSNSDTGSSNRKKIAAIITDEITQGSKKSIFSDMHGAMDVLLKKCKAQFSTDYELVPSQDTFFFVGMQFIVLLKGKIVGKLGVIHPQIVKNFNWIHPCAAWQLDCEDILSFYEKKLYK